MAIKFHPDKNLHDKDGAEKKFQTISEAFAILIDPETRRKFDQGDLDNTTREQATKRSVRELFSSFFGDLNPFENLEFGETKEFSSSTIIKTKVDDVELPIDCSLEELFHGCKKRVKLSRKRLDKITTQLVDDVKFIDICIHPGSMNRKRIVFPNEGDASLKKNPGDIIFIIKQRKHPYFTREGNNLLYRCNLTLCEALTDCNIYVPTLSGRTLTVPCPEVINPTSQKVIKGEGMPVSDTEETEKRMGDMIVSFQINFPQYLSPNTKSILKQYLGVDVIDQ